jgi:serine/threonine protein phosphatase PrpC
MSKMVSYGKTDPGLKRSNNEDAFVVDAGLGLFAVADGMGGAASGEIASRIFIETAREVFSEGGRTSEQDIIESIRKTFQKANENIISQAAENPRHQGMGCTAEVIAFNGQHYVLGHVGDSRAYLFRQGKLTQITKDHSLVQDELDRGIITPLEAKNHSLRHVIVRAVGIDETLAVDIIRGTYFHGDVFLLCSDGLTDMVADVGIEAALSLRLQVDQMVDKLIESAKSAGGLDNITIILCEVTS